MDQSSSGQTETRIDETSVKRAGQRGEGFRLSRWAQGLHRPEPLPWCWARICWYFRCDGECPTIRRGFFSFRNSSRPHGRLVHSLWAGIL